MSKTRETVVILIQDQKTKSPTTRKDYLDDFSNRCPSNDEGIPRASLWSMMFGM
jgi:hypothetical protein